MSHGPQVGLAVSAQGRGPRPAAWKPTRRFLGQAAFVAAVFGVGLFQGYRWGEDQPSPVAYEAGSLVATGELESVLYDPAPGARDARTAAGAAFTDPTGATCRRFTDGPVAGVACQRDGDWRIVELRQD